jgi:hypothetical protein
MSEAEFIAFAESKPLRKAARGEMVRADPRAAGVPADVLSGKSAHGALPAFAEEDCLLIGAKFRLFSILHRA